MPSSWSPSLRFELQFTGENINLWGDKLNAVLAHADYAVAGWLTKPLTGDATLTTANAGDDEARAAMIKFTGAGPFTVTIPAVSKSYVVWNACTATVTLTTGAGATATVGAGEKCLLACDGASIHRVQGNDFQGRRVIGVGGPIAPTDAATKAYVDAQAFGALTGDLPGQAGNAGKFLKTDGVTASWDAAVTGGAGLATVSGGVVTVSPASLPDVLAGTTSAKTLTPGNTYSALSEVVLTEASTITVDMSSFVNARVTLSGNRTLGNPINPKVGQAGYIAVVQDGAGSRTLALSPYWRRQGGPTSLSTAANAVDFIFYTVISPIFVLYDIIRNPT